MAIVGLTGEERGVLLDANAAYATMLELTAEDLIGAKLTRWVHPGDHVAALEDPLDRLGDGRCERLQFERRYLLPDGRIISAVITDAVLERDHGEQFAIEQALDITERKSFEGQLQHLADHDALTGLFNRRRFDAELERALAHARRFGTTGAVLALDLDGFKDVNDTLGHAAGDSLVVRLAGMLQRTLRETDVVARSGGDEFAVILPGTDERDACVVAEKLLSAIRRSGTVVQQQLHAQVTTSIGITTFEGGEGVTAADLLIEADIAMYDAKHAGKDCLSVYRRGDRRTTPSASVSSSGSTSG
jgi:diguanylate cyclase (GGDEF)-like protein/PAS domain S-box-containing protein